MDKKVKDFAETLKKKFDVQKLFLFGSRARGDWLHSSDYDFLVVSKDFEGMHFLERPVKVMKKTGKIFATDILCYTPQEFETKRKQIGIVSQAVKEGMVI